MMDFVPISEVISLAMVGDMLPVWLEKETEYANAKYGSNNPQLTALTTALDTTSPAYGEFIHYLKRFHVNYQEAYNIN
jgi:hypothetical protein